MSETYNPHGWNPFPEVTPPPGEEIMRVVAKGLVRGQLTCAACYSLQDRVWYDPNTGYHFPIKGCFYRPFVEEGCELDELDEIIAKYARNGGVAPVV